jgi:hypothetical protein
MIEIYAKGDSDSFIVDEVERWLIAPSASLIDASPVIEPVEPSTPPVPAPVPVPTPAVEPLFSICKRLSRDYREETVEAELEVGKIVNAVKDVVEAYFGDTFSLMDLCKQLTVSFTMSDNQSVSHDKIIRISENNYLGIKTCTRLTDQKLSLGIMKGSRLAKEFQAEIFILQPLNQAAVEKAQQIMSKIATEMTDEILEHF